MTRSATTIRRRLTKFLRRPQRWMPSRERRSGTGQGPARAYLMEFDPETLSLDARYNILSGCVVPRPIAFVSTLSLGGAPNLAPYSQFTFASVFPPALLFCVGRKPDKTEKDTVVNARPRDAGGTGEFVVNIAIEDYARDIAMCSLDTAAGVSEWELTSLHPVPSVKVAPCRVAHRLRVPNNAGRARR